MKRNETMLVYAVTGLLLVILLVAVVYGDQTPARADQSEQTGRPKVVTLPGVAPAENEAEDESSGNGKLVSDGGGDDGGADPDAKGPGATGPGETGPSEAVPGGDSGKAGSAGAAGPDATGGPGVAPEGAGTGSDDPGGAIGLQTNVFTPAKQLENLLGTSTRMGEYRVVKARSGDTLNRVVDRWCADAKHRSMVEVLNENLVDSTLAGGQEVVVPWVDAEVLLAAEKARAKNATAIEISKGQPYTLKRGDSLWKLASHRVAKNKIPAWLERFKSLNPDITDPSVLVAGQKVRLPR